MCGIAGIQRPEIKPNDAPAVQNMVRALYHRGPDSEGFYQTAAYCAGMRRLSINGLDDGHQPLYNEDRSVVLLYNGEIYNSPQIRKQLANKGHTFKTGSDGEVICHLWEEQGTELFSQLDGMYALALWVEKEHKLILARDIPGEKPLYYTRLHDGGVAFSSELKSLKQCPELDRRLNHQALWDFPTFLWIPEPETVYQDVRALPRGHMLISDQQGVREKPYKFKAIGQIDYADDRTVVEETRRLITDSIKARVLSDVPVGAFLSGGLDSSIVTAVAAKYLPELTTFTIGFEKVEDPYHGNADEAGIAEDYAKKLGSEHHTIRVTADTFYKHLNTFATYGDQPFSVSSGLGILLIAKAAHSHDIKVLLSGDGADECFGGYSWYPYLDGSKSGNREAGSSQVASFQSTGFSEQVRAWALHRMPVHRRAWAWHYYASEQDKYRLFHPDFHRSATSSLRHFESFKQTDEWEPEDFIRHDRSFYLPFEMLSKVDRMTMAYSVEGRVPFVAPAVLSHVEQLSYRQMVSGNTLKWVLREAFKDIVGSDVFSRPKHGFNVPIDLWLKNKWRHLLEETFSSDSALWREGFIHKNALDVARKMSDDECTLHGHTLFSFIMLNKWMEQNNGDHC